MTRYDTVLIGGEMAVCRWPSNWASSDVRLR